MRKCKCAFWDRDTKSEIKTEGLFHCWGTDFVEFESGPGNYTIAIVELPGGRIVKSAPTDIRFLEGRDDNK